MNAILIRALIVFIACLATIAFFVFVWPRWAPQAVVPSAAVAGVVLFLAAVVPIPSSKS